MAGTGISFDTNSLQTTTIFTQDIQHGSIPVKNAVLANLAHANASTIPFINYPNKLINIAGTITGASISALDTALDTFRSYFTAQDKNLDIDYAGGTRRYIATATAVDIQRPGGLLYAKFTIQFTCTTPFGMATSVTTPSSSFSPSATGRTLASYNDTFTFAGTAPYQLPVITLTMTIMGGSNSSSYITIGNGTNGQVIYIQRTYIPGDVVVVDCIQKTVTVNGIPTEFSGGFPEFPPGSQTLSYNDNFTTRTFTILVTYTAGYL